MFWSGVPHSFSMSDISEDRSCSLIITPRETRSTFKDTTLSIGKPGLRIVCSSSRTLVLFSAHTLLAFCRFVPLQLMRSVQNFFGVSFQFVRPRILSLHHLSDFGAEVVRSSNVSVPRVGDFVELLTQSPHCFSRSRVCLIHVLLCFFQECSCCVFLIPCLTELLPSFPQHATVPSSTLASSSIPSDMAYISVSPFVLATLRSDVFFHFTSVPSSSAL